MAEGERIRVRGMELEVADEIYSPAEDSLLLLDSIDQLGDLKGFRCLDVGTGTGVAAIFMAKKGCETFATDLSVEAAELAYRNAKINGVLIHIAAGNLTYHFRDRVFDLITFNPPYLPESPSEEIKLSISWAGGTKGREVIDAFLPEVPRILKQGGRTLILHADYNDPVLTRKWGEKRGLCSSIRGRRKLAFHELIIVELMLINQKVEHL